MVDDKIGNYVPTRHLDYIKLNSDWKRRPVSVADGRIGSCAAALVPAGVSESPEVQNGRSEACVLEEQCLQ